MRLKITSGVNTWLIAGESQAQADGNYQSRLLNELKLSQSLTALGSAPVTLNISVRNDDGYISPAIDLWGALVEITADGGTTWSGTITAYDSDGDGITYLVATEKAAPELTIQMPDEVARLVTVDENFHSSAVNVTLPLVFGGNSTKPHLIKGILIDKTAGIYLLCVGEIHQVVKVYRGTEEITTGFTAYTGTAGQADYAGFAYVQLTDEAIRKNDDGSYVEISADVTGLKLGSATIEQCRNGARVLYYLLTTAKDGVGGWGLGIATSEINTTAFNQAISDVDAAGLKFDGIFYFRQAAQSWIDQICLAIRGAYSIGRDGKRALYINKSAASAKTYTETNMRMLRHGVGAYTGRVYNKGKLDFDYNPITGQFMQSAQFEDAVSVAAIGEQEFYGQSYLIKDMATAQAILEYTCKKSLIGARKVYFETDELPTGARSGTVINIDRPDLGVTGDYQIINLEIGDHVHTIEAEKFDASIFSVGTPGTAIDWTKDPPIIPTINPGAASGLTLSSEVRPSPDGTNIIVLKGTFTPPAGKYLAASIEWGEGVLPILSWNSLGMVQGNGFEIAPVKPAQAYAVRVRMTTSTGHSDYVTATITTEGDEVPPGAPSIGVTSYLKTVKIAISLASVPSDMAGFAIYRHTSNNSAAASQIGSITSKDGRATYTDEAPAYGATYYYWVKSFDTWGNLSAFSSAGSVFISNIVTSDLADQILSESRLFAQGVVDAAALSNAALKQAGGAVAAWSAKGCTTASIAEAGGVVDTTGNGNNGQAFGGVAVVDTEIGKMFSFDGANDFISFDGLNYQNATEWSFSAWVKKAAYNQYASIYADYDQADKNIIIGYEASDGAMVFYAGSGTAAAALSTTGNTTGELVHWAFTFKGSEHMRIYRNGLLVAEKTTGVPASIAANHNVRMLGRYGESTYYSFNGKIGLPRMFLRALTATEVKSLYMFYDDAVFARISADFIGAYEIVSRHMASDSVVARILAAGSVTMEKLLIGAPGAALNDDPGFIDPSAWETMDGFESYTGWALATISDGKVGTGVMRGNGNVSPNANNFIQKRYTPVDLSKTYRLHCLARKRDAATNGSIYLSAREYDNAKSVLSSNAGHYLIANIAPGTTWTEYNATIGPKGQFQFPTGTAFVRIGGMIDYQTTAGAGYELQDFRLEECTPSTLIQNGAILAQHLTVEEAVITVGAQIANLVVENAHIKNLHGSKIEAGTLAITGLEESAQTTISDAYTNAGTALTNAATAQTTANNAASAAATAQTTANNAATAASNAQSSANTANNLLADIAADNKLTPLEKQDTRQEWDIIAAEKAGINAQATAFSITAENTTYNNAFQALATYLNAGTTWSSGIPSWIADANLGATTTIVGATFRANFKAYYDARTALLNAISAKAKTLADTAQSTANDAASAASAAASSAATANTKAGNLATNGLGAKVNYATFAGANNGELYLHGFDATSGAAADVDGWAMWNGAKVTVAKGAIDPNAICPYNIPLYVVQRSGTKYIVWFDTSSMAWKYSAADASAVLGTWTWAISTDIVLLTFVSPSSEGALVGTQLFVPPKTGRDIQDALDAAILSWAVANNLTYIDGAKIFTDTIYAHSINAAALKAPAGAVAAWSAKGSTAATIALAGGVKDVSGNGNHSRAINGVAVVDAEIGKAFSFDGINDYIQNPSIVLTSFTVSAWFRSDGDSSIGATGYNTIIGDPSGRRLLYQRSNGGLLAQMGAGNHNATITVANGILGHIAYVYDSATMTSKWYVNGVYAGQLVGSAGFTTATRWGAYDAANYMHNGILAHPKIHNRALTAAEVKTLYMIGTDTESGTVTADRVETGQLKSTNYSTNAGSMIDLDDGTFKFGGSDDPLMALDASGLRVKGDISGSTGKFLGRVSSGDTIYNAASMGFNASFMNQGALLLMVGNLYYTLSTGVPYQIYVRLFAEGAIIELVIAGQLASGNGSTITVSKKRILGTYTKELKVICRTGVSGVSGYPLYIQIGGLTDYLIGKYTITEIFSAWGESATLQQVTSLPGTARNSIDFVV